MSKVEVYGSAECEYTKKARTLLDEKGVFYVYHDVDRMRDGRKEMVARGGKNKTPQVFINDRPIGAWDDLLELERKGDLWEWLAGERFEGHGRPPTSPARVVSGSTE
ncbi:MAG: glutathione S-transferase N-terminal domain-containing protein [Euryarchaeota archaeon]|nr:glutathione S-transferase N-terminal domain-containing protein [Euryarchaeota archaeon]